MPQQSLLHCLFRREECFPEYLFTSDSIEYGSVAFFVVERFVFDNVSRETILERTYPLVIFPDVP